MDQNQEGFSLVELIVAMFLLAILALAVLPLMITATKTSTVNRSLVAATTFANSQLAPIRTSYPNDSTTSSCAALRSAFVKTGTVDPAGTGLLADVAVSACPVAAALPGTVTVTVTVYRASAPTPALVSLPTLVLVATP